MSLICSLTKNGEDYKTKYVSLGKKGPNFVVSPTKSNIFSSAKQNIIYQGHRLHSQDSCPLLDQYSRYYKNGGTR